MIKQIKKNAARLLLVCIGLIGVGSVQAATSFVLPTPENNPNASYGFYPDATSTLGDPTTYREAILMNGIPIAFKYDDFWSYSAHILESIQTVSPGLIPTASFGSYNFSTGTGTIDVNLTSNAGGATNIVDIGGGTTLTFQDPADLFSNQTIEGWECDWGGATQTCDFYSTDSNGNLVVDSQSYSEPASNVNGTSTVGEILSYLQSINADWTIPLLYTDYNQTGAGDSLFFSMMVEIINPSDSSVVDSWYLDSNNNGARDKDAPTYNFGDISFEGSNADCIAEGLWNPITGVGCAGVTADGSVYSGSHNLGSGHADFMAFAEDMDLSKFNSDYLFKVTLDLGCIPGVIDPFTNQQAVANGTGCNTNGGEEFGILGGVGPTNIPEPDTMILLGIGLFGLGYMRRQRKHRI